MAGIWVLVWLLIPPAGLRAQSNSGELRLKVTDPQGLAVKTRIDLVSEVNRFHKSLVTDAQGMLTAKLLPFGLYRVEIQQEGFAPFSQSVEVRSVVRAELQVTLSLAPLSTSVMVTDVGATLIDPHGGNDQPPRLGGNRYPYGHRARPFAAGSGELAAGLALRRKRGFAPRGSEYQTQFVVDGIPLTDNRSPSFGPEIEADDVQSMSIYTAGIPAEYGRKLAAWSK